LDDLIRAKELAKNVFDELNEDKKKQNKVDTSDEASSSAYFGRENSVPKHVSTEQYFGTNPPIRFEMDSKENENSEQAKSNTNNTNESKYSFCCIKIALENNLNLNCSVSSINNLKERIYEYMGICYLVKSFKNHNNEDNWL
jgi:hypothetical protein